jgi:hypothetical protein
MSSCISFLFVTNLVILQVIFLFDPVVSKSAYGRYLLALAKNIIKESLTIRAYHVIKEEQTKSIVISQDELLDFIRTTNATFGVFRIKTRDENFRAERYFLLYIVF